jgi:hypothetical protein
MEDRVTSEKRKIWSATSFDIPVLDLQALPVSKAETYGSGTNRPGGGLEMASAGGEGSSEPSSGLSLLLCA